MNEDPQHNPELDERTMRELTQLADGTLAASRRPALQARVAASPELEAALRRQRAAVTALRELELAAPAALRARLESERREARPAPRRRLSLAGAMAATCAAAAVLAVLLLPAGGGEPGVTDAARLAARPATQAEVAVDRSDPKLLAAALDGVPFPNLEAEFGWRQAGARADHLDGREARTVYYQRGGRRIAYTIVSGDPIAPPDGAREKRIEGVRFASFEAGGSRVVTWLRHGRTCVLSGRDVPARQLLALASWRGKGSVSF